MMSFGYDPEIKALLESSVATIPEVIARMEAIDAIVDGNVDGLKWFNWLYLAVTKAVAAQVASPEDFIAVLDVQFANLYFNALWGYLSGGRCPKCWSVFFDRRADDNLARLQFAIAGINAHINHDLPFAIGSTCEAQGIEPERDTPQYAAYTALNATLDALIDPAKREMLVSLPGDHKLIVHDVEWEVTSWGVAAARELAWTNAGVYWKVRAVPGFIASFRNALDDLTATTGEVLLTAV
jgi:hypothetical protein